MKYEVSISISLFLETDEPFDVVELRNQMQNTRESMITENVVGCVVRDVNKKLISEIPATVNVFGEEIPVIPPDESAEIADEEKILNSEKSVSEIN